MTDWSLCSYNRGRISELCLQGLSEGLRMELVFSITWDRGATAAQSWQTAAQSHLCLAKRSTHTALWNTSSPRGIFFWKSPGLESEHGVLERQLPLL